ncbi:MAG: hypothetical protein ABW167_16165 [Baekduia sp.]
MARNVKTKSRQTSQKPGRAPLVASYATIEVAGYSTWLQAEPNFLGAMQAFDALVAQGVADQGDIQNGKGDYFNDVLARLLEKCSGKTLHSRPNVPGLSFPRHMLDVAYPPTGTVRLAVETKATGIPRHPRNAAQPHVDGRAGSADLEKRIKEASFKNIDLKGEVARLQGQGGGATSNLSQWLRATDPQCYLFLSVRVRDDSDLRATERFAHIATTWFDGVGLCAYGWDETHAAYEVKKLSAPNIELDRVLAQVCTTLRSLP